MWSKCIVESDDVSIGTTIGSGFIAFDSVVGLFDSLALWFDVRSHRSLRLDVSERFAVSRLCVSRLRSARLDDASKQPTLAGSNTAIIRKTAKFHFDLIWQIIMTFSQSKKIFFNH